MSNHLPLPPAIVHAYTVAADGWTRATPWSRSTKSDHLEAIYKRDGYGQPTAVKVHVRNAYIVDATAAMFEINMQIKAASGLERKRQSRRRRPRPGQRMRQRA